MKKRAHQETREIPHRVPRQTTHQTPHQSPRQVPFQATMHRPTQKEKTARAFRAYLDLLDTADWIQRRLKGQLESFDLTIGGFRLLELLYREGPMTLPVAAEKRQCNRQNFHLIVKRLEECGWLGREFIMLPPAEKRVSLIPKAQRGQPRRGRRVSALRLTPLGEKLIGRVIPKRAKLVKALMRALDGREQQSLSRMCDKLREGDVVKFVSEMTHLEVEE
jgi:DNA-binding MarR family transcriptional regulator